VAGKPFVIDTRSFEKKGDARIFFKEMLNRYQVGEVVNKADDADLRALLKHHTEYQAKIGMGVAHFEVMANLYGTQCFKLVRTDGTQEDFSYVHCITPKKD
jgi:hypothetical protein